MNQDEEKLSKILSALPNVEAPKDFDLRLKGRIARADFRDSHAAVWHGLRFALPAILILGVFGWFLAREFQQKNAEQTIATTQSPSIISSANEAVSNSLSMPDTNSEIAGTRPQDKMPNVAEASPKEQPKRNEVARAFDSVNPKDRNANRNPERGGGSQDRALSEVNNEIYPRGLNPKNKIEPPKNFDSGIPLTPADVLSVLGIETESIKGKLIVKSVKSESIAARSGIKVDDEIEAMDGRPFSEPIQEKKFEGRRLTVKRGDKVIEISLANQP